jgi:hypothetical protein
MDRMTASTDSEQGDKQALPYKEPMRTWAGRGTGALCSLCGLPIMAHDIEYEIEQADSPALQFHVQCYRVWEGES